MKPEINGIINGDYSKKEVNWNALLKRWNNGDSLTVDKSR
jgi:hypothetical protein